MKVSKIFFLCVILILFIFQQHYLCLAQDRDGDSIVEEQSRKKTLTREQSVFEDSSTFKLFLKGTLLGTMSGLLDKNGNYTRNFKISMAGQTVEYNMTITSDENGVWKSMEIINPTFGTIRAKHERNRAEYKIKGEQKTVELPDDYVIYDDYGIIYESVMLKKYDIAKGGKQTFKRFRIPENPVGGSILDVEAEYLGEDIRTIKGEKWTFLIFNWKAMGVNVKYLVDKDYRIYLTDSPTENAMGVREGFEELIHPKAVDPLVSKPEFEIYKKTMMIQMRDGMKLSTDLYFPDSKQNKFPVILIRSPYKKEMSELEGKYYARRGYVVAIQDVRGRFASEGEWEPFVNEAEDGFDTVEWLAAQDWATGKVGMIGASYLGWVQFWAASQKPPHLTTIIPNVAPPDPFFNIPYEYGSFFILGALWWAEVVEKEATAELSQKTFFEIGDRKYEDILNNLPVIDIDKGIFGKKNQYWRKWVEHNVNDSYWERANFLEKLEELDIPVFLQSGWFDGDGIGTKLAYLRLKKSKNKYIKMVLGPWGHTDQASSALLGRDFGEEAAIDLQTMYLRWFDYWLKGIDNKIVEEPLVQLYTLNSEKWLKADTYPLPKTRFTKLYLSSKKGANTLEGDGKLIWEGPGKGKEYDAYTYDPGDPTPAWQFRFRRVGKKGYENITRSRNDILVYETEPFQEHLTIAGPVSAKLYASSSARDTDWFVTFHAVSEEGELIPLGNPWGRGTIRARFRNSTHKPEFLEKSKVYEYTIDLWHTGITFEKGWRIRIEVTSAFFPFFSRNLNTGGHNEMETKYVKAEQKIYHSRDYPSHLILPVVKLEDFETSSEQECCTKAAKLLFFPFIED
ncbi:MAG: CocE/NonD family hydrolase [Candidatus Aminicenantes bacterium]|nr:MAG: CocE/NonD family hydrolase [Candidatus Aminicenantes bacterium]